MEGLELLIIILCGVSIFLLMESVQTRRKIQALNEAMQGFGECGGWEDATESRGASDIAEETEVWKRQNQEERKIAEQNMAKQSDIEPNMTEQSIEEQKAVEAEELLNEVLTGIFG